MIVGEFPSEADEAKGNPLVGFAGAELAGMLSEAGLARSQCFVTLAIRIRPPANDIEAFIAEKKSQITPSHVFLRDRMVTREVWAGTQALAQEIAMVRPNVIIALGNVAMWALTGKWGITSWRASLLQCDLDTGMEYAPKVIPTYSPAMVMRQYSQRPVVVADLRRAKRHAEYSEMPVTEKAYTIRPTFDSAKRWLHLAVAALQAKPMVLSVDIETRAGHIACIGIAMSSTLAICIPLMCVEREEGYWTEDEEVDLMLHLKALLTHPNARVIGQNFLYDAQYFHRWLLFIPRLVRDTMIAQHVCFSNMQKSLDFQASMYCENYVYWKDDGKEWNPKMPEDQLWSYNCDDACITFEVDTAEQRNVDALGLREVHDFQQRLFWPVLETMNRGVRPDTKLRGVFAATLVEEIAKRETWLNEVTEQTFNIRSHPQMTDFFYRQLNFTPVLNRKTRSPSCDDEALGKISAREPLIRPFVRKILELRSLGVFLSTFVNAPLDTDGRIRCSFNIAGTDTYRFSSSKNAFGSGLNLQNIPKGGDSSDSDLVLPNVRSLFIPDPGMTFFDIDLSSADLRIVVWEADEPELKAMLREGLDPYTEIAKEFYGDPKITKKDPRRQTFKSFAHGTNYLGTAKGLAERLGLSVHDAERTQKWYFRRFPRIEKWQKDLKEQVAKRRMVQNVFGYRMYFFDRIEGTIYNQAAAWIPQSTVGCLINRAYVNIYEKLREVQVLLQVHDSLAGQFPTEREAELLPRILECASIELPYSDPLVIPVGVKTSPVSWGECE